MARFKKRAAGTYVRLSQIQAHCLPYKTDTFLLQKQARVGCSRSEIFEKDNGIKTFLDDDDGQGKLPSMSKPFPTANVQTPLFSSHKVHGSYVDCVRWFGDLLLTKSVEQCLKLWAPELRHDGRVGESFRKVKEFPAKYADIYYLRFAVDVGKYFPFTTFH